MLSAFTLEVCRFRLLAQLHFFLLYGSVKGHHLPGEIPKPCTIRTTFKPVMPMPRTKRVFQKQKRVFKNPLLLVIPNVVFKNPLLLVIPNVVFKNPLLLVIPNVVFKNPLLLVIPNVVFKNPLLASKEVDSPHRR